MESWKKVFIGKIPKAIYQLHMINGEEQGLELYKENCKNSRR